MSSITLRDAAGMRRFVCGLFVVLLVPLQSLIVLVHGQTIVTSKDCVNQGDTFIVTFQNSNELFDDWVAIIPEFENPDSFTQFGNWVWGCGTKTCMNPAASGRIRMRANISSGSWRAVLVRNTSPNPPWDAYAISNTFTVSTSCDGTSPSSTTTPAPSPGVPATGTSPNDIALQHIEDASIEIESLIRGDSKLGPQFIRMSFHDCIGGCDGCIDLDNHDNAGIEPSINALEPIVFRHAIDGVTRADIWALSSIVATDIAQRSNSRIDFTMNWWGRRTCDSTGQPCFGPDGNQVECSAKKGPHHEFPNNDMHTHELYGFFSDKFGFNQRETIVIMGAHTVGVSRVEDFNIDGPNGWVLENEIFDIGYYEELVGSRNPNDPIEVLINDAPAWQRTIENGTRFWTGFPNGVKIIMLNTDMALVRQLDDSNMDKSIGRVNCTFEDSTSTAEVPVCPHVEGALQIAAEFFGDNIKWLTEYRDVLDRMLTNGHNRQDCDDAICQLV